MIHSCKVNNIYVKELIGREFTFTPGLNVIVGENGSGKTTLLRLIGALCGTKNGWSAFAEPSYLRYTNSYNETLLNAYFHRNFDDKEKNYNADVKWDGTPVLYCNIQKSTSQIFGASGGALDSFEEVMRIKSNDSSGYDKLYYVVKYLELMKNPPSILSTMNERENDIWMNARQNFNDYVLSCREKYPQQGLGTLLFDEIDSSLSLVNQKLLWDFLQRWQDTDKKFPFQIICVSHSYYALNCKNANIIEMTDNWKNQCLI